jgi:osmotically-inducible protein OsmY
MPENRKQTHAVEKALADDERTTNLDSVHVKAVGAAVFLEGEVNSRETRDTVEEVTKGVDGVKLVRNRLQINPDARPGGWRDAHHHEDS